MAWYNSLHDLVGDVAKVAPIAGLVAGGPLGGAIGSAVSHIPGLQGATEFLKGNGGKNALGALQGVNAAYNQQKSSGLANNALGTVQAEWDRRAPLRAQGQAQMLAPGQGIAARIAAVPNRNPYATPSIAPVARAV